MWELLPLALLSAIYPTLVAFVVVALGAPRPARLMVFFLVGGMIASVGIGSAIVYLARQSSFVTGSRPPADPIVYFGVGVLALIAAVALTRHPGAPAKEANESGRVSRLLSRGEKAMIAFAVGLLLNLMPGAWYIVALKDIAQSSLHGAEVFGVIVTFCVIQYALIEIPLLGFVFAPRRATELSRRFSTWLGANSRRVAVWIFAGVGCYMIARGIVSVA